MTVAFDPFTPTEGGPEDKFRPSLVARAKKRTVESESDGTWLVAGEQKLGDSREYYHIRFDPEIRKYICTCYQSDYGQVRRAKICSHVLAVILYRRENAGSASPSLPGEGEPVDRDAQPSVPEGAPLAPPISSIPPPSDPSWQRHGDPPLPSKFQSFAPHQEHVYGEIMDAFTRADVVMVDAPTGAGKTLLGEMVRRGLGKKAIYNCSSKSLQEQFLADFPYSHVLKGRSNYPTQTSSWPDTTCADCTKTGPGDSCSWCPNPESCAYPVAKERAIKGRLAVVNTSYLLNEANYVGGFSGRDLVIVDECDTLEKELMGFVQFEVTAGRLKSLGLWAPKKGSHKGTIATWLDRELLPAVKAEYKELPIRPTDVKTIRRKAGLANLIGEIERIVPQLTDDRAENWIRDNGAGPLTLKPVRVDEDAKSNLWKHAKKWLLMSATIVSGDQLAEDLGIDNAGLKWELVKVPHTFPVENRRVIIRPVADMAQKHREASWPRMGDGIRRVLEDHPHERVLVHTVSYALSTYLCDRLADVDRPVLTYTSAAGRDEAVARFRRSPAAVLFASSLDRGVDLRDDDCRVVVVAKIPFPYLGDEQVSARLHGKGGRGWYGVQTVRTLVQMLGRGVRSREDWAVGYVLDSQFTGNVWKRSRGLLPSWFREALKFER